MSKYYNAESIDSQQMRQASAPQQARIAVRAAAAPQQLQSSAPMASASFAESSAFGGGKQKQSLSSYGDLQQRPSSSFVPQSSQFGRKSFPEMPACSTPVVKHDAGMLLDYKNDPSPHLDLGKDGAFSDFNVLFFAAYDSNTYGEKTLLPALRKKGFRVTWHRQDAFAAFVADIEKNNEQGETGKFDVIGFTSTNVSLGDDDKFVAAIKKAHQLGSGLFIFADNQPYTYQLRNFRKRFSLLF